MSEFKWYRWLRGGMWAYVFWRWNKVPPDKYADALRLMGQFHIEDHRYFKRAAPQKKEESQ